MKTSIPKKFEGETAVVVATGPSINKEQISAIGSAWQDNHRVRIITVNNAYQIAPFTDIQIACNDNWWQYYLAHDPLLKQLEADCWTRYKYITESSGIDYIDSIVKNGL